MKETEYVLSEATRRRMSEAGRGKKKSESHRKNISAALKGRVVRKTHEKECPCGNEFKAASPYAKYCSEKCKRAAFGHGRRYAPEFMRFPKSCAICGGKSELVGDHDHATGKPRGILCRKCNLAIGNMRDEPRFLREAANYLEGARTSTYLSGPMTGLPDLNRDSFHAEAALLRSVGVVVVNPADIELHNNATWQDYMRACLVAMLSRCNRIHLLPGWEKSKGAILELSIARQLGFAVSIAGEGA